MDRNRLNFEIREMHTVFPRARLFRDNDGSLYWELIHTVYTIHVFYTPGYPFVPANIYISPALNTHHHAEDLSVCWQKGGEWNPSWTATTVLGKAIQFIAVFKRKRSESYVL
jgi:hypothetical protein